jgi:hypothetical protein
MFVKQEREYVLVIEIFHKEAKILEQGKYMERADTVNGIKQCKQMALFT